MIRIVDKQRYYWVSGQNSRRRNSSSQCFAVFWIDLLCGESVATLSVKTYRTKAYQENRPSYVLVQYVFLLDEADYIVYRLGIKWRCYSDSSYIFLKRIILAVRKGSLIGFYTFIMLYITFRCQSRHRGQSISYRTPRLIENSFTDVLSWFSMADRDRRYFERFLWVCCSLSSKLDQASSGFTSPAPHQQFGYKILSTKTSNSETYLSEVWNSSRRSQSGQSKVFLQIPVWWKM